MWSIKQVVSGCVVCAALLVVGCTTPTPRGLGDRDGSSRLAVLGLSPPRVTFVDPVGSRVSGSVSLRSPSLDIVSGANGDILSAQCGGPGGASDRALGVVRPSGDSAEYVDTDAWDPEKVAFLDEWGVLIHGEIADTARRGTLVAADGGGGYDLRTISLPVDSVTAVRTGELLWVVEGGAAGVGDTLHAFDQAMEVRSVTRLEGSVQAIVATSDALFTVQSKAMGASHLGRHSSSDARTMRSVEVTGFDVAVGGIMAVDSRVIVAEYSWEDPDRPGGQVAVYDANGLELLGRIVGLEGPCAMTGEGDTLWVLCQGSGELVTIDLGNLSVTSRVTVGDAGFDLVDLEFADTDDDSESDPGIPKKAMSTREKNRTR